MHVDENNPSLAVYRASRARKRELAIKAHAIALAHPDFSAKQCMDAAAGKLENK